MNLHTHVSEMLSKTLFWNHAENPFSAFEHPGDPNVLFITGDNGSGKSLIVEHLRRWTRERSKMKSISVSIRERTGAGSSDGGMRRTMMFGDESTQSTGATSVGVIQRAFKNLKSWCGDLPDEDIMMVLDEPEIGLSHAYASAMGTHLARSFAEVDSSRAGLVIVTHNQALAQAFFDERKEQPTFVHMGKNTIFEDWLKGTPPRTVDELLSMRDLGGENKKTVWRVNEMINDPPKMAFESSSLPRKSTLGGLG